MRMTGAPPSSAYSIQDGKEAFGVVIVKSQRPAKGERAFAVVYGRKTQGDNATTNNTAARQILCIRVSVYRIAATLGGKLVGEYESS
jgi:hypothetical protein